MERFQTNDNLENFDLLSSGFYDKYYPWEIGRGKIYFSPFLVQQMDKLNEQFIVMLMRMANRTLQLSAISTRIL